MRTDDALAGLSEADLDEEELVLRELEAQSLYDDRVRIDAELAVAERALASRGIEPALFVNVGCGPATHHLEAFLRAHPRARAIGVDVSPTYVALAERETAGWSPALAARASFRCGDMRSLPVEDGAAGFVGLFGNSFGFFDDAENELVMAELRRVLCAPGLALITVPSFEYVSAFRADAPLRWIERGETRAGLIEVHGERYYVPERHQAVGRYRVFNRTTGDAFVKSDLTSSIYPFSGGTIDYVTLAARNGFAGAERFPLEADQTRNALGLMRRMDCIALHC